jgi:hypothetical protein
MRSYIITLLLLVVVPRVVAQDVTFTASAPGVVEVGEQFNLTFSSGHRGEVLSISLPAELTQLYGPSPSMRSESAYINGKMTSSTTYSYTYVLVADKEGTYTVGPAVVRSGGKEYNSTTLTIKVVKGTSGGPSRPARQRPDDDQPVADATATSDDELFLRWELGRPSLYVGESVFATLRLYTRVNLTGLGRYKAPGFAGFLTEELPVGQVQFERVDYNGRVYEAGVVGRWVLSPQHAGELTIDPFEMECRVMQRVGGASSLDLFFGGGSRSVTLLRRSRPVKITVNPLPVANKPAHFGGVVGNLTISAALSRDTVRANDALTYKITLRGNGNLRLMEAPVVKLPPDLELYDPKITRDIQTRDGITSGSVTFEYVIIPRFAGDYTIPAPRYSYFNLLARDYKTITGSAFNIHVLRSNSSGTDATGAVAVQSFKKEEVRVLGEDIRYIKTVAGIARPASKPFYGSLSHLLSLLVPLVVFVAGILLNRRRIRANADIARVKSKRAGKMARGRLKSAAAAMTNDDAGLFYQEVLTAAWGYVSYKLDLPASELNRDNINELLERRNVPAEMIAPLIDLLDRCEYARYAPGSDAGQEMKKIYDEAMNTITRLDARLTRTTKLK